MNKTNYTMKYTGHNRYGMLTRFFMFYFVIIIMIYTDQRFKYILKDKIADVKSLVILLGFIDLGVIIISMIVSF